MEQNSSPMSQQPEHIDNKEALSANSPTAQTTALPTSAAVTSNAAKYSTASKVLLILGLIAFALELFFTVMFGVSIVKFLAQRDLGTAIGASIYLVYFGVPGLITGGISLILNIVALCLNRNKKALKITAVVLSAAILILCIVFLLLINS